MGYRLPKTVLFVSLLLCSSVCFAQKHSSKHKSDHIAAVIDGHVITKKAVFEYFKKRYKNELQEVVQELLVRWMIRNESKKEQITVKSSLLEKKAEEETKKIKKQLKKKLGQSWEDYLKSQGLTEKQYQKEALSKWRYNLALQRLIRLWELRQKRIEARHILLKTEKEAREILLKLRKKADFATLAKKKSLSRATGKVGGLLPLIYRGDLEDLALEKALFSLKPREISDPVKSRWGYHIVQVLKIFPGRADDKWKNLKDEIIKSLAKKKVAPGDFKRWLKQMQSKYKIKQLY